MAASGPEHVFERSLRVRQRRPPWAKTPLGAGYYFDGDAEADVGVEAYEHLVQAD